MGLSLSHAYAHTLSVLIPARNVLGFWLVEQRFPLDMLIQWNFGDVDGVSPDRYDHGVPRRGREIVGCAALYFRTQGVFAGS